MIEVKGLTKVFKLSKKQQKASDDKSPLKYAVKNIDFTVATNEIFGLLGPNGAGKTTTLRCLSTLISPTKGTIVIDGFSSETQSAQVRKTLAFLTNELKLDTHFTPDYTVKFFGRLHGMDEARIESQMTLLFDTFGVTPFRFTKISDLSTGMKQKLSIVVSLIHDPQVIIFDEPTNGLDIITAKTVTDYLLALKKQGKTIIISTHIMHLAERLCDRIAIILEGEIHEIGTAKEIMARTNTTNLEDAFFILFERAGGANV